MQDNDFPQNSTSPGTYRATTNLNTALENPQMNLNSATGVNIPNPIQPNMPPQDDNNSNYLDDFSSQSVYPFAQDAINNPTIPDPLTQNLEMSTPSSNINSITSNFVSDQLNHSSTEVPSNQVMNFSNSQPISDIQSPNKNQHSPNESTTNTSKVMYEPVMQNSQKNKKAKISIPRELKVMLIIIMILIIFMACMPSIYDFFKKLHLVITSG